MERLSLNLNFILYEKIGSKIPKSDNGTIEIKRDATMKNPNRILSQICNHSCIKWNVKFILSLKCDKQARKSTNRPWLYALYNVHGAMYTTCIVHIIFIVWSINQMKMKIKKKLPKLTQQQWTSFDTKQESSVKYADINSNSHIHGKQNKRQAINIDELERPVCVCVFHVQVQCIVCAVSAMYVLMHYMHRVRRNMSYHKLRKLLKAVGNVIECNSTLSRDK